MKRSITDPSSANATQSPSNLTSTPSWDWEAPTQLVPGRSQPYSERSSDSGASFSSQSDRSMNRGSGGYRRRGGRGRGGFSGGQGDRKYSSSSGSSDNQNHNRPVIRELSTQRYATPLPVQHGQGLAHVEAPVTPVKEQSSFTLNGNTINETYTPNASSATPSPRSYGSPSKPFRSNHNGNTPTRQSTMQMATPNNRGARGEQGAYHQECTIKILDLPKMYWTKHVHQALSDYGHIMRICIEMRNQRYDNIAFITFQTPLQKTLPRQITVGHTAVRWEFIHQLRTTPSPVDPTKRYCEVNTILAESIDFGVQDAEMSLITMHTVQAPGQVRLMLNLDRKELDVQFPQKICGEMRKYRFRLPIAFLSHIYKASNCAPGQTALIIPYGSSPQFFVQKREGEKLANGKEHTTFSSNENKWLDWHTWFRETDVMDTSLKKSLIQMPLMNNKESAIVDIGRWTSYRILLNNSVCSTLQYKEFASALADHGVEIRESHDYVVKGRTASPLWTLLQEEISGTHPHFDPVSTQSGFDSLVGGYHLLFPIRYQLEACLSNGYLKEHNITPAFLEKLMEDSRQAIYVLEKVVDKQQIYYDPMEIFKIRTKGSVEKKVPSYCTLQRSVIITPTMVHVTSPIMETSNRITRQHAADADRFIRVKFSDEKNEGVLRSMPNGQTDALFDRVRRAMKNGIVVAGRYYEFLAFGNSQFREHGAYFYAPTSSKDADDIRSSLGDFNHIKTVAKFGARLGQCFSTTRAMTVKVTVVKIPDVERNGYCFTDGVGKLSLFLAQMAAQELGLSNAFDDPPSLYQFRLGGCKGVLALDPKITGSQVHIRPSQNKFEAKYTGLEIIRSSALATPFFNRQIIVVLSDLGVPDHVIIKKQQQMVNDYEIAMTDEATAIEKLRKHIDMNQTTLTMAGMVLDGFMKSHEPFMMSLVKLWRASTIKNLKEKARIAIEDGAFVLGCVDETATLKGHYDHPQSKCDAARQDKLENLPEIFLQVDDTASNKRGHYRIVEGVCILARNPSLHPGDVRVVRAVNVAALHHLKNVVVLPQTGDRDLANMCSGGDLDGDDYMVLWDHDLIPELINIPPMDFTPDKPIEKGDPITVSDITEFFVTYMQNDSLGRIAHAHLAQADMKGVSSETCLELARLHSQAVDYPKSGIPAQMGRELRPKRWPHFMEKKHIRAGDIYKSTSVLGKLYDQVELVDFKPQWEEPFDVRVLEAFQLNEDLLRKAAEIKQAYDEALKRLMAKHGIRTEFEAWSVFVLEHNQESRDYKFAEDFGRTIGALKAQYKEMCRDAAGTLHAADWNHLGPFVAAMYTVTARETQNALKECRSSKIVEGQEIPVRLMDAEHMPLISFPWLFYSELGKIATGSSNVRQTIDSHIEASAPHRKKPNRAHDSQTEVGELETEDGVILYGELLKLDFNGVQSASQSTETQQSRAENLRPEKPTSHDGKTSIPPACPNDKLQDLQHENENLRQDQESGTLTIEQYLEGIEYSNRMIKEQESQISKAEHNAPLVDLELKLPSERPESSN